MSKRRQRLKRALHNPHILVKLALVLVGVFLVTMAIVVLWVSFTPIPALNSFDSQKIAQSTKIYDRTGKTILYDLNNDVSRDVVSLSEISENLQLATLAIEDSGFYNHGGISIPAIIRSLITDIIQLSYAQGGSTLTQQVVKNTILTGEKSITRKLQEWVLAIRLEQRYSKKEILEFYFNVTPYGGTMYGAEVASRAFYGKSANDLTLAEAAYLAAIPQLPTYYSPFGNNRDALDVRKNIVLGRMEELGYITPIQLETAKSEVVTFSKDKNNSILAPHFVFFIEGYLEEKYGPGVATQGLSVVTTLDADLQSEAETIVSRYGISNEEKFNASNAALVAIDPKTGQILSMVGSRDYFDEEIDGNFNIALAKRQPGSSFKPFVYAAALASGYTPQTIIFDLPTQFSTICSPFDTRNSTPPCYSPGNYDDKFRGPMTFTTALSQSINVPAVKVLYLAGIPQVLTLAKSLGISTLGSPSDYGLSLALGAAEVRLLDLVSAYTAFANDGVLNKPVGILKITTTTGEVLEEYKERPDEVLSPSVARDISFILSNNEARFPEYPPNNPFYFPGFDVAAKTGTTNESRDAWTVGYTPTIVVGVWAGNNNNTPMVKEVAGFIVAPMWREVMQYALTKYPAEYFKEASIVPLGLSPALSGIYVANDGVPHDILHWVRKGNPRFGDGSPSDSQYTYWEYPVSLWHSGGVTSTTTPVEVTESL